jgi:anion-transporting  ArsA/GET3 family ATPase
MTPRQVVLDDRRLVVCVGSGGVGKTTSAASIGLWAAMQGKKVLVLTIDPARRLANSLGLTVFGNDERRIDLSSVEVSDGGELWAMMLDTQTTFNELIKQMAPNKETAQRILDNPIYQTMSDTFAGSQEYMAAEKLHDVVTTGRYDLVVLDTPPVKNALDFFEAPGRLSRFFDRQVISWFLNPPKRTGFLGSLKQGTSTVIWKMLGYVFGHEFLEDLSDFLLLFQDMYEGFRERHQTVQNLFRSNECSFVTVCAPTEPSVEVAGFFSQQLSERGYPRGGTIVNQVHLCGDVTLDPQSLLGAQAKELSEDLQDWTAASLVARLGAAHRRLRALAAGERVLIEQVQGFSSGFLIEIPRLEGEVHDLHGLARIASFLFKDASVSTES